MDSADLLRDLGAILREVAFREILPRFRALAASEVYPKATTEDPDDLVTQADHAAEATLLALLPALVSGSSGIGEEGVAADPSQLDLLRGDAPVWVVDPLDGTRNFASGRGPFGTMAALVHHGVVFASGIFLPLEDRLLLAARGEGAFVNGTRLRGGRERGTRLVGTSNLRFAPSDDAASLVARGAEHDQVPPLMCAAHEYSEVAEGRKDYVVYFRLLPWDHAPGSLIVREAGGVVRHPDGTDYDLFDGVQPTLVAPSEAIWRRACEDLFQPR